MEPLNQLATVHARHGQVGRDRVESPGRLLERIGTVYREEDGGKIFPRSGQASAVLDLDKTGPVISNGGLTPNRTNGSVDVALQATASDVSTGNSNVTAAEYFIDPSGSPAGEVTPKARS